MCFYLASLITPEMKKAVEVSLLKEDEICGTKDIGILSALLKLPYQEAIIIKRAAEDKSKKGERMRYGEAVNYNVPALDFSNGQPLPPHLKEIFNEGSSVLFKNSVHRIMSIFY